MRCLRLCCRYKLLFVATLFFVVVATLFSVFVVAVNFCTVVATFLHAKYNASSLQIMHALSRLNFLHLTSPPLIVASASASTDAFFVTFVVFACSPFMRVLLLYCAALIVIHYCGVCCCCCCCWHRCCTWLWLSNALLCLCSCCNFLLLSYIFV